MTSIKRLPIGTAPLSALSETGNPCKQSFAATERFNFIEILKYAKWHRDPVGPMQEWEFEPNACREFHGI